MESVDINDMTQLHLSCRGNSLSVVQILIKAGANLNCRDSEGRTPVMIAAINGQLEILRELKAHHADFMGLDFCGEGALQHAVRGGRASLLPWLISSGLDPTAKSSTGWSILHSAVSSGDEETENLILDRVNSIEDCETTGTNALNIAARDNRLGAAKRMLQALTNEQKIRVVNNRSQLFDTCLYRAAGRGHVEMIELLLDNCAEINLEVGNAGSPLMVACAIGRLEAVKVLVKRGASLFYISNGKEIVSALAAAKHHKKVQQWLESCSSTNGTLDQGLSIQFFPPQMRGSWRHQFPQLPKGHRHSRRRLSYIRKLCFDLGPEDDLLKARWPSKRRTATRTASPGAGFLTLILEWILKVLQIPRIHPR